MKKFFLNLNVWIFLGILLGIAAGFADLAIYLSPFRTLFLNGIKCVIGPLLFSTLITGLTQGGSERALGKLGLKSIVYFECVTTLALIYGLLAANLFQPGKNIGLKITHSVANNFQHSISWGQFLEHLIPANVIKAFLQSDILGIVIFACLFSIAALKVGEKAKIILQLCEASADVFFKLTNIVMLLAPLGIAGSLACAISEQGVNVLLPLLKLLLINYGTLAVFVCTIFIPILIFYQIPVLMFFSHIKQALLIGFTTTSSEAAYPVLANALQQIGVPRRIAGFVLPLGYSFNLDGSTLYLALALLFVAQAADIQLSMVNQLWMMLSLMLTTKGVAAVPRATMIVLSGTLVSFGLPAEGIPLLMAVDYFMDMPRTLVNVLGNSIATAVIAKSEGAKLFPL